MLSIKQLLTEYRENPLGIDCMAPRFSWVLESDGTDVVQEAYRLVVTSGDTIVWNSGTCASGQSVLVPYAGEPLVPCTRYDVRLEVRDNQGETATAQACFETGLLHPEDLSAAWVASGWGKEVQACPVFARSFDLRGTLVRARLYITAHGLYEAQVNGRRVGDAYFAPGWTSYHRRLQYQTYDVTELLAEGGNLLQVTLADGWWCGPFSFMMTPDHYGTETALLAELRVWYADGTCAVVATDGSWEVGEGPIRASQIYLGEEQDATFEPGPATPAVVRECPKDVLVAQESELVRITKRTAARTLIVTHKGEQVLDFGQNMSGFVELHVHGAQGQRVVVRHAETLDRDGNFYPETLRQATSVDTYVCDGSVQVLAPHFTFHGFRYACIEGLELDPATVDLNDFVACTLHTDMAETGTFRCSDRRINQLWSNISWGMRSNFLDIPTDCPQRDERLGWTGDAQIFAGTATYLRNCALFFGKWLRDLAVEQTPEWGVPQIVPNILGDQAGIAAWGDAATIIPWEVYETYGDTDLLRTQYPSMRGWVDYITAHCGENGLWQTGFQYGDWLALDKEEGADRTGATDRYLVANAYYAHSCDLVARAAAALGEEADAARYAALHEQIVARIREEYVTATGRLVSETQTGCVLALHFGLAPEHLRPRVLAQLVANIEAHKNHLSCGFVGTPYLCHVLSENGRHDLAGTIFMQEDYPSWLYAVKRGATTIWERWDSIKPDGSFDESGMNSLNHYAYGSIGEWMHRKVLGLELVEPGYRRFAVRPLFVKGITWAEGRFESVYGTIGISWRCEEGLISLDVQVPVGTTAEVSLPERDEVVAVGSGTYDWEYLTTTDLRRERFSLSSTLAQVLDEPGARELFDRYAPGSLDSPLIQFAMQMTLAEVCATAPQAKPLYERIVAELNAAG